MVIGAAIGLWRAKVVEMTGMPELIALLHSFVGLAAVLVGWNGYLLVERDPGGAESVLLHHEGMAGIHSAEVVIGCSSARSPSPVDRRQPQTVGPHLVEPG